MNNTTSPTANAKRRTRQPFGLAADFRINNLNRGATQGRPMKAIALAIVAVPAAIAGVWAWRNKNLPPIVKTIAKTVVSVIRMVVNPIQEKIVTEVAEVLEDLPPASTDDPALAAKMMKLVEAGQPVLLVAKGKKTRRDYRGRLVVRLTAGDIYMFSVQSKDKTGYPAPLFALADVIRIVKIPGLITGLEVRVNN